MTIRRLEAGELAPAAAAEVEAHLKTCARCAAVRRELEDERRQLAAAMPFDAFAAGVAEKLATRRPARRLVRALAPLAVAASVALVATMGLRGGAGDDGVRAKGGASVELFVQDQAGVRAVASGEKLADGARLLPAVHGVAGKRMVVTLIEPGESTVLYDGPAKEGALPQAFEWTGRGAATLRLSVDGRAVADLTLLR